MSDIKKKSAKSGIYDCALVFQDGNNMRIVGGQKMGYPMNHRTQFCWSNQANRRSSVGIRIQFPRLPNSAAAFADVEGHPSEAFFVDIRLHVGTWTSTSEEVSDQLLTALPARETTKTAKMCMLRFKLNDGEKPFVEGFGLPYIGNDKDNLIVSGDGLLDGVKSLRDICSQTEFTLLFGGLHLMPKGRTNFQQDFPDPVRDVFPYSIEYVI